jgi:hypothetical protein
LLPPSELLVTSASSPFPPQQLLNHYLVVFLQTDRPEHVTSPTTTGSKRQHARSTPVVRAVVDTVQPRPAVRSTRSIEQPKPAVGSTLGNEQPRPAVRSTQGTEQPRPACRSTLSVGGTVHLGWQEPRLTKTPWELERHKRQKPKKVVQTPFPERFFKKLPKEVYECIVVQLEQLHLAQDQPCPACRLRDFHSLSLVSRAWDKATIPWM